MVHKNADEISRSSSGSVKPRSICDAKAVDLCPIVAQTIQREPFKIPLHAHLPPSPRFRAKSAKGFMKENGNNSLCSCFLHHIATVLFHN